MEQRREARINRTVRFFVNIFECDEHPDLVGESVACEAIDFSTHGLQFKTEQQLLPKSLLNITIGIGEPFAMYLLRGEVRWIRENAGDFFLGILLKNDEETDLEEWVDDFADQFSA